MLVVPNQSPPHFGDRQALSAFLIGSGENDTSHFNIDYFATIKGE